jgi:predicted Ser/Thr protein kinase
VLTPSQWERVKPLLTEALRLDAGVRGAFLEVVLPSDPALRQEVVDMLDVYERASQSFGLLGSTVTVDGLPALARELGTLGSGTPVGRYRILHLIGEGGMGQVYLAEDEQLGRRVALKVLSSALVRDGVSARDHLMNEARAAATLNHPGIVTIHDVVETDGQLAVVMEHVEGRPLTDLLAEGPMPAGYALHLAAQLADALAYAHTRGIVHCDLKPGNIHVGSDRTAKILDFGLAQMLSRPGEAAGARSGQVFGTMGYLAPERLLLRPATPAGDVFALGVVLHRLLTGQHPFDGDDQETVFLETLMSTPRPPSKLVSGVPPDADAIVARCLAKSPHERMQAHEVSRTARELAERLNGYASLQPVPTPAVPRAPQTLDSMSESIHLLTGIVTFLALLAGFGVFLTFIGFVTSRTYEVALGLTGAFESESPLEWPVWGTRALVAPAVLTALFIGGFELLAALVKSGRSVRWLSPLTDLGTLPGVSRIVAVGSGLRTLSATDIAYAGIGAGTAALVCFAWAFWPIIEAINAVSDPEATASLAPLAPANRPTHGLYRQLSTLLVVGLFITCSLTWRRAWARRERVGGLAASGMATLLLATVTLWALPYRLLWHADLEAVTYQAQRCYLAAEKEADLLLFCTLGVPKRHLIVPRDSFDWADRPRLMENVFLPLDSATMNAPTSTR